MEWIFLSPHFDDAVFSCGGLIWELTSKGDRVQIWTICAGEIPQGELSAYAEEHHLRWNTGSDTIAVRRMEDLRSCKVVSASYYHFPLPDCIYRRAGDNYWTAGQSSATNLANREEHLYTSNEALFGPVHPAERELIQQLSDRIAILVPSGAEVVCPLTIGGHADHRLTRLAAEQTGKRLWYYADFPYVLTNWDKLNTFIEPGWKLRRFNLSPLGLQAWGDAVSRHASQISTFWSDVNAMRQELGAYHQKLNGTMLWRKALSESL